MADYRLSQAAGLEETLARLMELQAQPGTDQDENLLLLCLVNLMGIIGIMQEQLITQECNLSLSGQVPKQVAQLPRAAKDGRQGTAVNKTRKKVAELQAVPEQIGLSDSLSQSGGKDKIVNKVKDTTGRANGKIVKWDSRLKKSIKEQLYI